MFHPLPQYRNPCWRELLTGSDPNSDHKEYCKYATTQCDELGDVYKKGWKSGVRTRIRCIPYFYFVGVTKAGTTDLKFQLNKHPEIAAPLLSEINWWNRRRQGESPHLKDL